MGLGDLDFVVHQHLDNFPGNALSRLGEGFVRRYYRTFLDGPHAAACVAQANGDSVGYLAGILDAAEHRKLLRRYHGRELALSAARGAILHPARSAPLVRHRTRLAFARSLARARNSTPMADGATGRVAVLSHLVVSQEARSSGIGSSLVCDFLASCADAGADTACVATMQGDDGAGRLYARLGWTKQRERETFDGRQIAIYSRSVLESS
jgi:ribosomal protein S18 acetylase RimI-like enzyme